MGFGSIAKSIGGGLLGGIAGVVRGEGDGPGYGALDQRVGDVQRGQINAAKNYNVGGNIDSRIAGATGESRRNLAASMAGVRNRAQGRGQLWSGLKQQADLGEIGGAQADLNNQIADIRRNEYANRDLVESQAVGGAMDFQSAQQARENSLYQQALDRKQNRTALMNAGAQGLGSLTGMYMGSR